MKRTVISRNAVVAHTQKSLKAQIARPDAYLDMPKKDKAIKQGMHLKLPPVSKTSRNETLDAGNKKHKTQATNS